MKSKFSLQLKLVLMVALVIIITLTVFGYVSINNQKRIFTNVFRDSAANLAHALDAGISSKNDLLNIEKLQSNIYKLIWLNSNIVRINIALSTNNGLTVVASNNTSEIGNPADQNGINTLRDGSISFSNTVEADGTSVLQVITPVHVGGERVGVYSIQISEDLLNEAIATTQKQFLFITLIAIIIAIAMLSFFIKFEVVDSIMELLYGMKKIGAGDLKFRLKSDRNDEIGNLFTGLNMMTQSLDERTGELSHSKSDIEIIIDNLADGLIEYTGSGLIHRVNNMTEQLLGVSRKNIVGLKIMPTEDENNPLFTIYSIISHKKDNEPWEIKINQPLPTTLQIVTTTIPETAGQDVRFVSIIRDITREKLIDEEKSDFISVAAHQLRTPLSTTKWVFELLEENKDFNLPEKAVELAKMGTITNNRMIMLVNDLLAVSRIEGGRYGYIFAENDIGKLIEGIVMEYGPVVQKKSIKFVLADLPQIPKFVFDYSKLSVAIHGLLDNAINYTEPGGSVTISVTQDKNDILVRVADTGIGIPEEDMNKLFKKFYRAKNAVLASPDGTGLGLFIVKNIVTKHQGKIEVYTNKPSGMIFVIRLPMDNAASIQQ